MVKHDSPDSCRDEWDFSRFYAKSQRNNPVARACMIYEYARESPSIRAAVEAYTKAHSLHEDADAHEAKRGGSGTGPRLPLIETMKGLAAENSALCRINKHMKNASGAAVFVREPNFPRLPWLALVQPKTIDPAEHGRAAMMLPSWEVECDALSLHALVPGLTPVVPCLLTVDTSAGRKEIKEAILAGFEELMDKLNIPNRQGKLDAAEALKKLTAMRLLNRFGKDVVMKIGDGANASAERRERPYDTWQNYLRAREGAVKVWHTLFALPEAEKPISFPLFSAGET